MAKIVSPVWSSIRGSIAGTTYLTTPSGQIIGRQRTRPTQPTSSYRTAIRNAFTESIADWADLTQAERNDWRDWAKTHTGRSGRHEFVAAKSLLRYGAELPVLDTPVINPPDKCPEFTGTPSFSLQLGAPSAGGPGVGVTIKNNSTMDCWFLIECSMPFGLQRLFWKGPWNESLMAGKAVDAGDTEVVDIIVGLDGQKVFVRVRGVSNDAVAGSRGHVVTAAMISDGIISTAP